MPSNGDSRTQLTTDQQQETGPWDTALDQLREWDPRWAETCANMSTNPWASGVLPRKTVELISVAIYVACTNLNADGTRRHIRAALVDPLASYFEVSLIHAPRVADRPRVTGSSASQIPARNAAPTVRWSVG
jgi:hypothetical protein